MLGTIRHLQTVIEGLRSSLVPRPFPPPVFDHLQYAKMEGEGLRERVTYMTSGRHEGRREGMVPDRCNFALISLESTK